MTTNKTTKPNKTNKSTKTTKSVKSVKTTKTECSCDHAAEIKSVKEALEKVFGKISQCELDTETESKRSISDLKIVTSQDCDFSNDESLASFLTAGLTTCIESAVNPRISEEKVSMDIVSIMAAIHSIYLHGVRDGYLRHQVKSFKSLMAHNSAKILFKELADSSDVDCEDVADYNEKIDNKTAESLIELLAFVHPIVEDEHLKDNSKDNDTEKSREDNDGSENNEDNEDNDDNDDNEVTTYHVKLTDAGSGEVIEVDASSRDELVDKINKLKENGDIPDVVAEKVIKDVIGNDSDDDNDGDDGDDSADDVEDKPTKPKKFTKPTKSTGSTKTCKKDSDACDLPSELLDALMQLFSEKE